MDASGQDQSAPSVTPEDGAALGDAAAQPVPMVDPEPAVTAPIMMPPAMAVQLGALTLGEPFPHQHQQQRAHGKSKQRPGDIHQSMPIPRQRVGWIIGKQGAYIKRLEENSGCSISISDNPSREFGREWNYVQISGTTKAVDRAKKLLYMRLETFPATVTLAGDIPSSTRHTNSGGGNNSRYNRGAGNSKQKHSSSSSSNNIKSNSPSSQNSAEPPAIADASTKEEAPQQDSVEKQG
mmetsp:Transcript_23355/g.49780  ORF Transcript_23355/g.49780 Transcript_23355/m.49780 type:complete len:237 (+) Transcript_23355:235-945(+)